MKGEAAMDVARPRRPKSPDAVAAGKNPTLPHTRRRVKPSRNGSSLEKSAERSFVRFHSIESNTTNGTLVGSDSEREGPLRGE